MDMVLEDIHRQEDMVDTLGSAGVEGILVDNTQVRNSHRVEMGHQGSVRIHMEVGSVPVAMVSVLLVVSRATLPVDVPDSSPCHESYSDDCVLVALPDGAI